MKNFSAVGMAVLYIVAGLYHFISPATYLKIMPHWLPLHLELVYLSGFFEILFGLLLIFRSTRRIGAFGIIALLIAVFPANIQMAIHYFQLNHPQFWLTIVRLPLQFALIYWAYIYTRKEEGKRFSRNY